MKYKSLQLRRDILGCMHSHARSHIVCWIVQEIAALSNALIRVIRLSSARDENNPLKIVT